MSAGVAGVAVGTGPPVEVLRALFARQVALSARRIADLEAALARTRSRCVQLAEENRTLRVELDKARRAGKRQAAPSPGA